MTKEELDNLKKKIALLTFEEEKNRDKYLRKLALGEIQGPSTGYPSIDKPWLQFYKESDLCPLIPNKTVCEYFLDYIERFPKDHILMTYYGKKYNKSDIKYEISKNIGYFKNDLKLKENDYISMLMLNTPEAFFMFLAANYVGIICNKIKLDESYDRIKEMINTTNSKYFFVSEFPPFLNKAALSLNNNDSCQLISVDPNHSLNLFSKIKFLKQEIEIAIRHKNDLNYEQSISLKDKLAQLKILLDMQKELKVQLKDYYKNNKNTKKYNPLIVYKLLEDNEKYFKNESKDSKVAAIVYTGGTTGFPKGVQLTNKNINTMIYGVNHSNAGFNLSQNALNILPPGIAFYYNGMIALMCSGVRVDVVSIFTEDNFPYIIGKYKPNVIFEGPILLEKTRKSNALTSAHFIETSISGGDKLSVEEEHEYMEYLKKHGSDSVVNQGWGLSECAAVASYTNNDAYVLGTVGVPLINYTVGVFDYRTDNELEYGEIGELCIKSDALMKGYYNNQESTDNILLKHSDGTIWLHSDDLGYMDENGRIFHKGRVKRMLTRSGTKIWPTEIEDFISENPLVEKCCCVKMEDELEREVPIIHIVLKDDNQFDYESFVANLKIEIATKISEKSVPKYFVFRDDFPYSMVNKKVDIRSLENEDILSNDINSDIIIKHSNHLKLTNSK